MYIMFKNTSIYPVSTILEENFHSNLNLAIKFKFRLLLFFFRNLSMIVYMIEIQ